MTKEKALNELMMAAKGAAEAVNISIMLLAAVPENKVLITQGVLSGDREQLIKAILGGLTENPELFSLVEEAIRRFNQGE